LLRAIVNTRRFCIARRPHCRRSKRAVASRLSAGHGPKSFLGIIPRFGANTLCYLAPYSVAYGAGQRGKIVAKKEDSPCSRPVEPIMEQAHRGELVLAGARLENDPVRNLLEPVFSRL
jgi:hypothetical protein